ncbi:hypothetical protein ACFWCA_50675 [Streptomyces phaeochromogenes]|uniref:hypothetical protein n=1 Tax=Streptomyces phaeochromogenes TaxID=1923 RepID=UPI00367C612C
MRQAIRTGELWKALPRSVLALPTVTEMEAEYLCHGVPLADYQLTRPDRSRQHEAVQVHEWLQRHVAQAPRWSDKHWEQIQDLLGPPTPAWELQRWRLRLYCGHVIEATRLRKNPRPDGEFGDKERCPECGLDPAVIVAFEPLEPVAAPPPDKNSRMPSHSTWKPPGDRRSKAELVAENKALRVELDALQNQA